MADIEVRDDSSLWIVLAETALGHDWLKANLQEDADLLPAGVDRLGRDVL